MEKKDRYISIGEMAKINRTTVPTLRLYDSMGLLTPYYTDEETHYRYYDIKQNARFDMIQYMKELGMELKEIKEFKTVLDLNYQGNVLVVVYKKGKDNLGELIDYLHEKKVAYSKIFSKRPTLNDVFLELTGKDLRD